MTYISTKLSLSIFQFLYLSGLLLLILTLMFTYISVSPYLHLSHHSLSLRTPPTNKPPPPAHPPARPDEHLFCPNGNYPLNCDQVCDYATCRNESLDYKISVCTTDSCNHCKFTLISAKSSTPLCSGSHVIHKYK